LSFSTLPLQRSIGKPSIGELALGFLKAAGANRVSRAFFAEFLKVSASSSFVRCFGHGTWTAVQA
jgi:hypothetical protein